ncbi:DsbA family protein [Patescibacteria group bacterium]|nr:DsbA family protein [Patescibacteria group bacterium]MBU0964176.1 DsbA family protein [Patescibacteria group bacterium]
MKIIEDNTKPNLFEVLGPGKTFFVGMVATILVGFSVGFFILLFSGDGAGSDSTNTAKVSGAATNSNIAVVNSAPIPTNTAQPTQQVSVDPVTSEDHIKGNLDSAGVVIVEFSDTECPFCARFHETMLQVVSDYGDKVAWVYRHFPLDQLHSKARNEAIATECAAELGGNDGFWTYLDRLMEITPSNDGLQPSQLPEIAEFAGLDVTAFQTCLDEERHADIVKTHEQDAASAGGQGTPYSVAISKDGQIVPINGAQPITSVKSTIDSLLQ